MPLFLDLMNTAGTRKDPVDIVDVSSVQTLTNKIIASSVATPFLAIVPAAAGAKLAGGSGNLVSGTAVVATGLTSVTAFGAIVNGATGFATGATEVSNIFVSSVATGAVTVKGIFNSFATGAATISVSGTGGFLWLALGS